MVSNSDRQPLARNQADKVPAELHHLGLPGSNISAKVIEQNVFNGDYAWYIWYTHLLRTHFKPIFRHFSSKSVKHFEKCPINN